MATTRRADRLRLEVEQRGLEVEQRATMEIGAFRAGATHKVRFGDVVVTAPKPSAEAVRRSAELGTEALRRTMAKLLTPGIRLRARKDVPLFSVDPDNPALLIRLLNGRRERGVLEDGQFKVTG